jgi:hypothetical protein
MRFQASIVMGLSACDFMRLARKTRNCDMGIVNGHGGPNLNVHRIVRAAVCDHPLSGLSLDGFTHVLYSLSLSCFNHLFCYLSLSCFTHVLYGLS